MNSSFLPRYRTVIFRLLMIGFAAFPPSLWASQQITIEWGEGRIPGRTDYIAVGASCHLFVNAPSNVSVMWFKDGNLKATTTGGRWFLQGLQTTSSGNYQARWQNQNRLIASDLLPLNVGKLPRSNFENPTTIAGGDILIRNQFGRALINNEFTLIETIPGFSSNQSIVTADLTTKTCIHSNRTGGSPLWGILSDGSSYRSGTPYRRGRMGEPLSFIYPIELNGERIIEITDRGDGGILIRSNNHLVSAKRDGTVDYATTASQLGLKEIVGAIGLIDGQVGIHGVRPIAPGGTTPGRSIRLTATGQIDPEFNPIDGGDAYDPPTLLSDGSWARLGRGLVQRWKRNGEPIDRRALPTDVFGSLLRIAPTGDLYGYMDGLGIVRYLSEDLRPDPNFFLPQTLFGLAELRPLLTRSDGSLIAIAITSNQPSRLQEIIAPVRYDQENLDSKPVIGTKILIRREDPFGTGPRYENFDPTGSNRPGDGDPVHLFCAFYSGTEFHAQWTPLDGTLIPVVSDQGILSIPSFSTPYAGRYQLRVSNKNGTSFGPIVDLRPTGKPRLSNLSGRVQIDSGDRAAIAGFVLKSDNGDTESVPMLMRSVGPSLSEFGISVPLADPVLFLRTPQRELISHNDDWTYQANFRPDVLERLGAFSLPDGSRDAALYREMTPGIYTAETEAKFGQAGISLAELYVDHSAGSSTVNLTNLSLRGYAGTGDKTLVGGFVIEDPDNLGRKLKVLIRAVGPTLREYNVELAMSDPILEIFNSAGEKIEENDNWSEWINAGDIQSYEEAVGAFPLPINSHDAAVTLNLSAGAYTAHVQPRETSEGVVLLEIYAIPD